MKSFLLILLLIASSCVFAEPATQPALRVFIRSGVKTHGPGQHDHPRFLKEYTELLNGRGIKCDGSLKFPTAEQLAVTDVLVMYAQHAGSMDEKQKADLTAYVGRGGGVFVIHDAVCSNDPQWFKTIVGGAWEDKHSKWHEGPMHLTFTDHEHPITRGIGDFDLDDEIYWDLHLMPEAHVMATSSPAKGGPTPQMWTYEKDSYRSFVWIQGHLYDNFLKPRFRAIILRGIAWTGKRDADVFLNAEEKAALK